MTSTPVRTWAPPDAAAMTAYITALLTSPSSLLPGLTAIEAEAAMRYVRSLPMRRDRSVVDVWAALDVATRDEWVARTRADLEAVLRDA